MSEIGKMRWRIGAILLVVVPLGFATKFYHGPASAWVANSLSGMFYEIFWCLVLLLLFPRLSPWKIAGMVFLITSLLEFTQLLEGRLLLWIRSYFLGRILIGTTFRWGDLFYYLLGSVLGALILVRLAGKE